MARYGNPTIMGNRPGQSMANASFNSDKDYAKNAVSGSRGEVKVMELLQEWCPNDSIIFPSVKIPGQGVEADIDFCVIRGNRILLVDAKNYKGGVTYSSDTSDPEHRIIENGVFGGKNMGQSMTMAVNRLQKILPGYVVDGLVLFAPLGEPSDVRNLVWPGGYRTYYGVEGRPIVQGYLAEANGGHNAAVSASCVMAALACRNNPGGKYYLQ